MSITGGSIVYPPYNLLYYLNVLLTPWWTKNKKVLLFYSPSINQDGKINSESKYIYDELKNKINENIISLSNILSKEMFVDSVHYNKLGHEEVSKKISIELNNLFK